MIAYQTVSSLAKRIVPKSTRPSSTSISFSSPSFTSDGARPDQRTTPQASPNQAVRTRVPSQVTPRVRKEMKNKGEKGLPERDLKMGRPSLLGWRPLLGWKQFSFCFNLQCAVSFIIPRQFGLLILGPDLAFHPLPSSSILTEYASIKSSLQTSLSVPNMKRHTTHHAPCRTAYQVSYEAQQILYTG